MKLHLVGIFHTLNQITASHCAFTGKVFRFAKMMQQFGYEVVEYANESTSECRDKVNILSASDILEHSKRSKPTDFWGDDARLDSSLFRLFDARLRKRLTARFQPGDIVCHPFGPCHKNLGGDAHVETGIGYPETFAQFKIFESYAWMHYHQGKDRRGGNDYEWVVPNYFDLDDWEPKYTPGQYLLYFGRITLVKGLDIVKELASHVKVPVVICGQGDPTPWQHPNIIYVPPISGAARSSLLRNAIACLMPTRFTEPFGGAGIEGMLCGTPLIAADFGAFAETVVNGVNGFRCHTLGDWLEAVDRSGGLDRESISTSARAKYSLSTCGARYDQIFQQINDLRSSGWFTKTPRNI